MTWLAVRQSRMEMALAVVALVALAGYLVPTGLSKFAAFEDSGLKACLDAANSDCLDLRGQFVESYNSLVNIVEWFNFVPVVIGLLLAVPIVNEFDRTYRLAWTQSVTRRRWLVIKIGLAVLSVVLFAVAFTLLMTWWHAPLVRVEPHSGRNFGPSFTLTGILPFAFTFWAFALALGIGAMIRRAAVSAPVALVMFIVTRISVEMVLQTSNAEINQGAAGQSPIESVSSKFWEVQLTEASIFVGAALILVGITVGIVSRRMR